MYNSFFRDDMTVQSIVSFSSGDVNGDGIPDNVYLTGIKTSDSPFTQNITLVIQDGRTGRFISIPLSDNLGYNPRLFLGEFTGDGIDDIFISIDSGGSGAIMYHYIYSFINNTPRLMFDFNSYTEEYNYEVTYKDNYKAQVISRKNNKNYIIDISTSRDDEYLHEIYYENGKLKSPISGFVNPLSGLYPVDFDSNNVYELLAYQKIAGRYNADSLGYVLNTLKWKDNMFILDNQYVAIF
ncbi:hypothetical protein psyc5s11_19720 [Clostridium gelidum]|uniref:VCBS repeat-containing protein n=1 Tax=Clostridium gelidum TaxID=704125 RepID=A0ABM7T3N7_9CLOT|nr:VCBS repeat-containing protein [Clostridium gelidum]BCZ45905.1 hypothetical protein psyc5s11_19720 [Clostridium gelidum]